MPEKIAIVTGGSRGIGAMVTKLLLQCHMEVIIGKYYNKIFFMHLKLINYYYSLSNTCRWREINFPNQRIWYYFWKSKSLQA